MSLKIIFAGTPEFAAESLKALLEQTDHNLIGVYTQPDRPAGRGKKLVASPVKQLALQHQIPVFQPLNFNEEGALDNLQSLGADLMVVAAYGLILPKAVLDAPRLGCINIHASLLPRWRGAAPIQRAIQAGDHETGITIMQMNEGLDTGDMLFKRTTPISKEETGGSLHDRLAALGGSALIEILPAIESQTLSPQPQDDTLANYASKLSKQEAEINWKDKADQIERNIRAFNPWPVAYTTEGDARIRLLSSRVVDSNSHATPGTVIERNKTGIVVQCGEQALCIQTLQLPGAKAMSVADFLNGNKPFLQEGTVLGA